MERIKILFHVIETAIINNWNSKKLGYLCVKDQSCEYLVSVINDLEIYKYGGTFLRVYDLAL